MGCITTAEPVHKNKQPSLSSPDKKKSIEMQVSSKTGQVKIIHNSQGKIYLFGQSSQERLILQVDCIAKKVQIMSSRKNPQYVDSKQMQQQLQMILEDSLELNASILFNKDSHPPYNSMFATYISEEEIFLCGGTNYQQNYLSEEAFTFKFNESNQLMGLRFQRLANMKIKRCAHFGLYYANNKKRNIFVFGGIDQNKRTLLLCQQYSFDTNEWVMIPPMQVPRKQGFCVVYNAKIYVFGGTLSSQIIQMYDPKINDWQKISLSLHRSINRGAICSSKPNQILILGGNSNTKSTIKINLKEKTYIWQSRLKQNRNKSKVVRTKDHLFMFGGLQKCQKYGLKNRSCIFVDLVYPPNIAPFDIEPLTTVNPTTVVEFEQVEQKTIQPLVKVQDDLAKAYIFGSDDCPCILQVHMQKFAVKRRSVPMSLRLRGDMGVIRMRNQMDPLHNNKYFVCGGRDNARNASRSAYWYDPVLNKCEEVVKMVKEKSNFAVCVTSNAIFVFGGQTDLAVAACEKYIIDQNIWVTIAPLSQPRADAKALLIKGHILVIGGSNEKGTVQTVQIFNLQEQLWRQSIVLNLTKKIRSTVYHNEKLYVVSGEDVGKWKCHQVKLNQINIGGIVQMPFEIKPYKYCFVHKQTMIMISARETNFWQMSGVKMASRNLLNQPQIELFIKQQFSSCI